MFRLARRMCRIIPPSGFIRAPMPVNCSGQDCFQQIRPDVLPTGLFPRSFCPDGVFELSRPVSGPIRRLSHHNGSVWPHDSMLTALGMAEYGLADQRGDGGCECGGLRCPPRGTAPGGDRCGFSREEFPEPVRYRLAGVPQVWSAAAGIAAAQLLSR